MENSAVNEKWISLEEAAEHLGIKPVTIRSWIRNNKDIPAHKIGKQWKFKRSELEVAAANVLNVIFSSNVWSINE